MTAVTVTHRASEVDAYLAERIRQPYPSGCSILEGSTPVVSFGDVRSAWVATVGLNPSDAEFQTNGQWLTGHQRHFETLDSLGLDSLEHADDEHILRILDACYGYFQGPNPYWQWFRPLETVLSQAVGASYADGSAAHLDLVQWATSPTWAGIPSKAARATLVEADREFLRRQLAHEGVRLVLMNGRRVMTEAKCMGVPLQQHALLNGAAAPVEIMRGHLDGTEYVGWNKVFPNGGISAAQRHGIVGVAREIGTDLQPGTRGGNRMGSIPRNTQVTSKSALADVLREWMATGEATIGDIGRFGGTPWVKVTLTGGDVVLNADTKRAAVKAYLDDVAQHGAETPWPVVANSRGRVNKVAFRADGVVTPGWYAYTTQERSAPGTV